jgi:hypothetical protein
MIPMEDQAEPIGRVIAVSAAQLIVLLQPLKPGSAVSRSSLGMAALVKVPTRTSVVFGMVSGLRVPLPSVATPEEDLKIIEIELIGETSYSPSGKTDGFRRGVSAFPGSRTASTWRPRTIWPRSTRRRAKPRSPSARSIRTPPSPPSSWSMTCSASISALSARPALANPAPSRQSCGRSSSAIRTRTSSCSTRIANTPTPSPKRRSC